MKNILDPQMPSFLHSHESGHLKNSAANLEAIVLDDCPQKSSMPPAGGSKEFVPQIHSGKQEKPSSLVFRRLFFPKATHKEWRDWRWQWANSLTRYEQLARILHLSEEERKALNKQAGPLPLRITPYYASLLDPENPDQPLRKTVVPVERERIKMPYEEEDPLGEETHTAAPGLVHRYPDRVLFLVTGRCAANCRYCTRSRIVGNSNRVAPRRKNWEAAIAYIERTPSVRDVLLSGGDPLTLPDSDLEWLLARLRRIPHVEIIRIGTKVPAVMPQRITSGLTAILKRFHPLWMSIHFTHPDELTHQAAKACGRLADTGIPLGSQTVLLAGINDDVDTMTRLFQGLLRIRVRPYYMYQCDLVPGTSHFRTPVKKGLEILKGLRGHTSGYAVPSYVIDAPGGGGKIPILPDYRVGVEANRLILKNYQGKEFYYYDTSC